MLNSTYVQETGRAGRDGIQAEAVLHKGKIGIHTSLGMRNYVENTSVCRRVLLLGKFLLYSNDDISKCKCCDLCSQINFVHASLVHQLLISSDVHIVILTTIESLSLSLTHYNIEYMMF